MSVVCGPFLRVETRGYDVVLGSISKEKAADHWRNESKV